MQLCNCHIFIVLFRMLPTKQFQPISVWVEISGQIYCAIFSFVGRLTDFDFVEGLKDCHLP